MTACINTSHKAVICTQSYIDSHHSLLVFFNQCFLFLNHRTSPHLFVLHRQGWMWYQQRYSTVCSTVHLQLPTSLSSSFMSNLERISAQDYIPTEQDVLRVRFPTTGIHDYSFTIKPITLRWPILRLPTSRRHKSNTTLFTCTVKTPLQKRHHRLLRRLCLVTPVRTL